MKKEDMMRLYYGGKAVLKTELNKIYHLTGCNFLLLFFLAAAIRIFPQVPVNGFCKYSYFSFQPGFTRIFTTNFNKDSYTDLIFFNPAGKEALSVEGMQAGLFGNGKVIKINSEISQVHNIIDKNNKVTGFAFSSRKGRKAGIIEITKNGRIKIQKEIILNSYPDNITSSDIDGDGTSEFLLSGAAFDGLSLIAEKEGKLVQQQVTRGTSYSNAIFSDISNDGFADIAAPDIYGNTIDIFYNNSQGSFEKVRTIRSGNVNYFRAFDMNLDYYEDLIYSSGKRIVIAYGDPASSFESREEISTSYIPDKILTADFNRDGKIDLAYVNFSSETISLLFAKENGGFYPEIFYLRQPGIKDIVPYYSKFISGIAGLTIKGKLFIISHLTSFAGEVNISLGIEPAAINYFDYDNNGITDICFIDRNDMKLKLMIRNPAGIPNNYYSVSLYENQSEILPDDSESRIKTFYCYSLGKRLIEAITIDFNTTKVSRQSFYSPGPINEIKISNDENGKKLYTLYIKNNELGLSVISYHDFRYNISDYGNIAKNVASANISLSNAASVYYWKTESNHITLSSYSVDDKSYRQIVNASLPGGNIQLVSSFLGDLLSSGKYVSVSFFKGETNDHIVIAASDMTRILQAGNIQQEFGISGKNDLYYTGLRATSLKKLVFYNPETHTANKFDFLNRGRSFIITRLAEINKPVDYFVKNMSYKKYHIVYTNSNENCITIKEI